MGTMDVQRIKKMTPGAGDMPIAIDSLSVYLGQVERFPLLSREEEYSLAVRYAEHKDVEAARTLVVSNLRFVVKIAMEYRHYRDRLLDLIQEGNIGLMIAVKKFNPYKGYRLISYAVWWIRAYIQAYISRTVSLVRAGASRARRRLTAPRPEGPAADTEPAGSRVPPLNAEEARAGLTDFSLDAEVGDNTHTTHLELLTDRGPLQEDALADKEEKSEVQRTIRKALKTLDPREVYILTHHLLADRPVTLEEIGAKFRITRERVRQIEEKALAKLRRHLLLPPGHPVPEEAR